MDLKSESIVVDRGMALHKMIRLITITTGGEAYLNFMGNEFGHPEWIDFPREGNGWSYAHARRQWSIRDDKTLRYSLLAEWDKAMIELVKQHDILADGYPYNLLMDEHNKTMVYSHRNLLFVLNWHGEASIPDYELPVREKGKYRLVLSTDEERFGGLKRQEIGGEYFSFDVENEDGTTTSKIKIYIFLAAHTSEWQSEHLLLKVFFSNSVMLAPHIGQFILTPHILFLLLGLQ